MEAALGEVGAHLRHIGQGEATVGGQGDFKHECERRQRGLQRFGNSVEVIADGEVDVSVLLALAFVDVGLHCPRGLALGIDTPIVE
ncbi:hypothetical protein D3C72_2118150 [compost metagenome]